MAGAARDSDGSRKVVAVDARRWRQIGQAAEPSGTLWELGPEVSSSHATPFAFLRFRAGCNSTGSVGLCHCKAHCLIVLL